MMNDSSLVCFHVGLGKVASTYLQKSVFPKLKGIRYIPTGKYRQSKKIIPKLQPQNVLVSREFDLQLGEELEWFSSSYPDARVILLLRRHDSWIASQYRRYVKNGWHYSFEKFFDLQEDTGLWKQKDLNYYSKIKLIERYFDQKPLVLFYDELQANPKKLFEKLATYCHATVSSEDISLKKVHTSYSEKQLLVLRKFCRSYVKRIPVGYHNRIRHWLFYRPYWAFFHLIMYLAQLMPERMVPKESLIDKKELESVKEAYADDWKQVREYANHVNPIPS